VSVLKTPRRRGHVRHDGAQGRGARPGGGPGGDRAGVPGPCYCRGGCPASLELWRFTACRFRLSAQEGEGGRTPKRPRVIAELRPVEASTADGNSRPGELSRLQDGKPSPRRAYPPTGPNLGLELGFGACDRDLARPRARGSRCVVIGAVVRGCPSARGPYRAGPRGAWRGGGEPCRVGAGGFRLSAQHRSAPAGHLPRRLARHARQHPTARRTMRYIGSACGDVAVLNPDSLRPAAPPPLPTGSSAVRPAPFRSPRDRRPPGSGRRG
jgi:hypothetical protein